MFAFLAFLAFLRGISSIEQYGVILKKTCNLVSVVNAFWEVACKFEKLVYSPLLPFLVQKPKNGSANLVLIFFKITEKIHCPFSCKTGLQPWGKTH